MSNKPRITLAQIQSRAGKQIIARAETYFRQNAIRHCVQRGNEIEALCEGSQPEPYRVGATLSKTGIVSTSCTCEYEWGDDCKHIVALLLTYLRDPARFEERPKLHDVLRARSKEDLAGIIEQMVTRYPDLQDIVERPVPEAVGDLQATIDTQSLRRELRNALKFSGGWMDHTAENKVREIANVGKRFAARDQYANAAAIYITILDECNSSEYPTDDEGEYVIAVSDTFDLLKDVLSRLNLAQDNPLRERVLDVLVGTFIADTEFGGIGYGDGATALILEAARATDYRRVREQIETAKKRAAGREYNSWSVETYENFLIDLDALDETDPEETLNRLREQGMHHLLAKKLLDMGRNDEAITVIRKQISGSYNLQNALDLLVSRNLTQQAIQIAEKTVSKQHDIRLVNWLIALYQKQGDTDAHFRWLLKRMESEPSIPHYADLKATAEAARKWSTLRPQVLMRLRQEQKFVVLTLAYLEDEEWDAAWDALEKVGSDPKERHFWGLSTLDFTVAEKTRKALPYRALPVYIKYARLEIEKRNRGSYAIAAQLLREVQSLYKQMDDEAGGKQLITDLRLEFRQLPAFLDELKKAKL